MTANLFIAFVLAMAAIVIGIGARYLGRRAAISLLLGLAGWLIYAGVISYLGVVRNTTMRPPGALFIFIPVILFLLGFTLFIARTPAGARMALAVPLWVILVTQSFRIVVELFIHQLWIAGFAPRMLTYAGANVDIYVGLTALLIAWISTRGRPGLKLAMIWNALGLLALANVVARAVLTSPGSLNRIHTEIPNQMIGLFPFTFIPAFFVPLAFILHVLAMRAIISRLRSR